MSFFQNLNRPQLIIGREGLYTFDKLPSDISRLISFSITEPDDKGKMEISPIIDNLDILNNNQTYIFTFKPDLIWHNRKKFSANDLVLNIPGTEISVTSPLTLQIKLSNVFSPALSLFDQPIFYGKTAYGLGPYQIKKIDYQDGFIKTLALKSTTDGPPITYKFFSSEKDLFNSFRLGQVNQIISYNLPLDIENWPKLNITKDIETNQYISLFFNTERLSSKQTRQSLAYAIPKTNDKNFRCTSPISPNSWAYNPSVKDYGYNVTRAKELFENNEISKVTLIVTDRKLLERAEVIKNAWKDALNIETEVTTNNTSLSEYDAILAFGHIPIDPDQYAFWHSTQTQTNITRFNNSRIDKLLEEGRTVFDQIERKKIYADFQKYLLEESPAVFLEFPAVYTITREN